jgi:hypothetical protein
MFPTIWQIFLLCFVTCCIMPVVYLCGSFILPINTSPSVLNLGVTPCEFILKDTPNDGLQIYVLWKCLQ